MSLSGTPNARSWRRSAVETAKTAAARRSGASPMTRSNPRLARRRRSTRGAVPFGLIKKGIPARPRCRAAVDMGRLRHACRCADIEVPSMPAKEPGKPDRREELPVVRQPIRYVREYSRRDLSRPPWRPGAKTAGPLRSIQPGLTGPDVGRADGHGMPPGRQRTGERPYHAGDAPIRPSIRRIWRNVENSQRGHVKFSARTPNKDYR